MILVKDIILIIACLLNISMAFADNASSNNTQNSSKKQTTQVSNKKAFKVQDVHPEIAVKDSKEKEIVLPGVMRISGESKHALDFTRARTISMTNGGSVSVYLSATEPNRIQLPFTNPHIVGTTDLVIDKRAGSNNVYIAFKPGVQRATQIYFEPAESGPVLGLQLIPKNIPAQTILVEDAGFSTGAQKKSHKSHDYISSMQSLMEIVALGGTPNGYSTIEMQLSPIVMNNLLVELERKLSHREGDIYVYKVTNPTEKQTMLRESEFDGDVVQAVSIYPKPLLMKDESTRVIVFAKKERGRE
jgi:conjugal transfer pilus assembly protein TraK